MLSLTVKLCLKKETNEKKKKLQEKELQNFLNWQKKKALERKLNLANRYVQIARKISMKYLVKIPKEHKRKFCKHCYSYLLPGLNSRVRTNNSKIVVYCKNCNKYTRIPLKNIKKDSSVRLK